ncbi:MAG TPA: cytochrome b/b6 domain-containing protein [Micavibrio sp.]|nr:cytochrome b/b6 domain-containing protein [Micavibrio sp.]
MTLANTEEEYGLIARLFHWLIAVIVIGLLPLGLFMTGMENSPLKFEIYAVHKSFGLLVFFLGLGRLVWRFISPPPDHLETHEHWEVTLASASHFWLYVCIIAMPLTGWLMSSAQEFPVPFFGAQLPHLIGKDEHLGELFRDAHGIIAYTLLFVLGLHVAGALKHHIIDKDETLSRMAYRTQGMMLPAAIVLVVGASFGISALLIAKDFLHNHPETPALQAAPAPAATTIPAAAPPDTSALAENGWAIVPAQSKLQFRTTMYGSEFTGDLPDFNGTIIFNPDDLSTARADIRINMVKVTTGDADRDSNISGEVWFASASFPQARYEAVKFEKAEGNNYVAIGNLTIRDKTMPVVIPFTLDIAGNTAHMKGDVTLNRLDYGMGEGEWEDEKTVGHDVEVLIDVTAIR